MRLSFKKLGELKESQLESIVEDEREWASFARIAYVNPDLTEIAVAFAASQGAHAEVLKTEAEWEALGRPIAYKKTRYTLPSSKPNEGGKFEQYYPESAAPMTLFGSTEVDPPVITPIVERAIEDAYEQVKNGPASAEGLVAGMARVRKGIENGVHEAAWRGLSHGGRLHDAVHNHAEGAGDHVRDGGVLRVAPVQVPVPQQHEPGAGARSGREAAEHAGEPEREVRGARGGAEEQAHGTSGDRRGDVAQGLVQVLHDSGTVDSLGSGDRLRGVRDRPALEEEEEKGVSPASEDVVSEDGEPKREESLETEKAEGADDQRSAAREKLAELFPDLFENPYQTTEDGLLAKEETDRAEKRIEGTDFKGFNSADQMGLPEERATRNIAAIQTLKKVEAEERAATEDEQRTMARYVGWGGLSEYFDPEGPHPDVRAKLERVLTDEEYEQARASTLTSFYTWDYLAMAMWDMLGRFGFKNGRVLDAGCGTGIFEMTAPESLDAANITGIEQDSISARIARMLTPNADIQHEGFENTERTIGAFDAAVGNIPFGDMVVVDEEPSKNAVIHRYFVRKELDMVRSGGIVAVISSRYLLDADTPDARAFRRGVARDADLLGAVRLPGETFSDIAGTDVVSDVLVFKKRSQPRDEAAGWPEWVDSRKSDAYDVPVNGYFLSHPEQVVGTLSVGTGRFGETLKVEVPEGGAGVAFQQTLAALKSIEGSYTPAASGLPEDNRINARGRDFADLHLERVRPFGCAVVDGTPFFVANGVLSKMQTSGGRDFGKKQIERIADAIGVSRAVRALLNSERAGYDDEIIEEARAVANERYDAFVAKNGYFGDTANSRVLSKSSNYPLLCSLEDKQENGAYEKSDLLVKRVIRPAEPVTHVETALEALDVSMSVRGRVDLRYMAALVGTSVGKVAKDLAGEIYLDPADEKWKTASEYLSGNVREKLATAREAGPQYADNYEALEKALPANVPAADIQAALGSPWIPANLLERFVRETLAVPGYEDVSVVYSPSLGIWEARFNKNYGNVKFGTERRTANDLFTSLLNQSDIKVFDTVSRPQPDGTWEEAQELNQVETKKARLAAKALENAWDGWWRSDDSARSAIERNYNELFNSVVPRRFDGSRLTFSDEMSADIELRPHQKNAVARMMFGGNTLIAHAVGAGKTYEMVAAAQEGKRLGLHRKAMFVVPNHLTEQWGDEYLRLYPTANILVATRDDFSKKNREFMMAKIATGDWDAVIIGHSQLMKIPLSPESQEKVAQIEEQRIIEEIAAANSGKNGISVKKLEKAKIRAHQKAAAFRGKKQEGSVCFDDLGIDKLFVDESHYFKNLGVGSTRLGRSTAGVVTTTSQKAEDLFAKCTYLDSLTNGHGVVFATGTPISNSIVEMFTLQRYLQPNELDRLGIRAFDAWAATFGETVDSIEINPTGTGFRLKKRFASFHNLPELMTLFSSFADVKTADMLDLDVPDASYETVACEPSPEQKAYVQDLGERADLVHARAVPPEEDNMLKITNDGRKVALDQRLIDPSLPDWEDSKVNRCVENVIEIYREGEAIKATQLVFCDMSTPKGKGNGKETDVLTQAELSTLDSPYCVYEDLRDKLIEGGIPADEIAFIQDAHTDKAKEDTFEKVRKGEIRVLIGSTPKMGAGTNVQDRLAAIHDLDCPWRPADLEQRAGRVVRQGNMNEHVRILRYVTQGTFDSYLYQMLEQKQRFITQVVTNRSPERAVKEDDASVMEYGAIKAVALADDDVKEVFELKNDIAAMKIEKQAFLSKAADQKKNRTLYAARLRESKRALAEVVADLQTAGEHADESFVTINGVRYDTCNEKGKDEQLHAARAALSDIIDAVKESSLPERKAKVVGSYKGFPLVLWKQDLKVYMGLKGARMRSGEATTAWAALARCIRTVDQDLAAEHDGLKEAIANYRRNIEEIDALDQSGWPREDELMQKEARYLDLQEKMKGRYGETIGNAEQKDDGIIVLKDEPQEQSVNLSRFSPHIVGLIRKEREKGEAIDEYLDMLPDDADKWEFEQFAPAVHVIENAGCEPHEVLKDVPISFYSSVNYAVECGLNPVDVGDTVRTYAEKGIKPYGDSPMSLATIIARNSGADGQSVIDLATGYLKLDPSVTDQLLSSSLGYRIAELGFTVDLFEQAKPYLKRAMATSLLLDYASEVGMDKAMKDLKNGYLPVVEDHSWYLSSFSDLFKKARTDRISGAGEKASEDEEENRKLVADY